MTDPVSQHMNLETRRHFFGRMATGIGSAALASLVNPAAFADPTAGTPREKETS